MLLPLLPATNRADSCAIFELLVDLAELNRRGKKFLKDFQNSNPIFFLNSSRQKMGFLQLQSRSDGWEVEIQEITIPVLKKLSMIGYQNNTQFICFRSVVFGFIPGFCQDWIKGCICMNRPILNFKTFSCRDPSNSPHVDHFLDPSFRRSFQSFSWKRTHFISNQRNQLFRFLSIENLGLKRDKQ